MTVLATQNALEKRLFKHVEYVFFSRNLNSFTSFKDFADFSKHIFLGTSQTACFRSLHYPAVILLFSFTCSEQQLRQLWLWLINKTTERN